MKYCFVQLISTDYNITAIVSKRHVVSSYSIVKQVCAVPVHFYLRLIAFSYLLILTYISSCKSCHFSLRVLLNSQLEDLGRKSKQFNEEIEKLKSEGKEEDALERQEDLQANLLEISKIKRRLLKFQKGQHGSSTRQTASESSEGRSLPDETGSDRASSSGSRSAHKGSSLKLSRECKAPVDKPVPPVDFNSYNDDGDIVIEGNVLSQIKVSLGLFFVRLKLQYLMY